MRCRSCGAVDAFRRHHRKGFLQRVILPLFGYYPWECVFCRKVQFRRAQFERRGMPYRASAHTDAQQPGTGKGSNPGPDA